MIFGAYIIVASIYDVDRASRLESELVASEANLLASESEIVSLTDQIAVLEAEGVVTSARQDRVLVYVEAADWLVENLRLIFGNDPKLVFQRMNTDPLDVVRRKANRLGDQELLRLISETKFIPQTIVYPAENWFPLINHVLMALEAELGSTVRSQDIDAADPFN